MKIAFAQPIVAALVFLGTTLSMAACGGCEQRDAGRGDASSTVVTPAPSSPKAIADAAPEAAPVDAAALDAAAPKRARAPGCERRDAPREFHGTVSRPEGEQRYEARLPMNRYDAPAQILFTVHPFGSSTNEFLRHTHLAEVFGTKNWVTVAPEGVRKSFNGGDCCGEAAKSKLDDVGLLLAIADDLRERACIDDERLYVTGFSNGGFLGQAFACAHPERVGAVASVGAVLGVHPCEPREPVSVLLVNGIGDDVIPPDGGGPFRTRPLSETVRTWSRVSGCTEDAGVTRSPVNAVCRRTACQMGRALEVCTVPYAHVWMVRSHPAGDLASARQTAREMLEFFERSGVPPVN
ncbi:MAG: alpha/beta fold hydrolase [Myxococcales bacterium]|nr:alpha/beta fold hydrolase [Myxococcales bacterium]